MGHSNNEIFCDRPVYLTKLVSEGMIIQIVVCKLSKLVTKGPKYSNFQGLPRQLTLHSVVTEHYYFAYMIHMGFKYQYPVVKM